MTRWERLPTPVVFSAVYALYVVGGTLAWWTIDASGLGALFFPPAGMTVVALLSLPRRRWTVVTIAVIAGELTTGIVVGGSTDVVSLVGFGVANTIGPIVGAMGFAALLNRSPGVATLPDLGRRRELIGFAAAAVVAGPFVSGVIGAATASWRFDTPLISLGLERWLGDALGVVVVAPLLLAWNATDGPRPWRGGPALLLVLCAWIGAVVTLAATDLPLMFLVLGVLVLAGAVFDVRTVALAGLAVAIVTGVSLAIDPSGLIAGLAPSTALTTAKLEFLVFAMAAYAVAAETNDRVINADQATRRLATVGELQRLLLPPLTISGPGFRARGVYDAAAHDIGVGGDWYLVRPTLDGRLVFAVGDIVGHDLDAARSMAAVRSGLVLHAAAEANPARLLTLLDAFSAVEPTIRYGTAWVGVFDPASHTLEYACAGHPPPLLVTSNSTQRLDGANTALIGLPQGERRFETTSVPVGASLLMYSDGLIETRAATLDDGLDRLDAAIAHIGLEPQALVGEMLRDSPRDDDTILAVIDFDHAPLDTSGSTPFELSWGQPAIGHGCRTT